MKTMLRVVSLTAILVWGSWCFASLPMSADFSGGDSGNRPAAIPTLDAQCVLDFTNYTFGTGAGQTFWTGGSASFRLTRFAFSNSCTPGTPFYAFCFDLTNGLMRDAYCVNIDSALVRAAYPEQYPAISYLYAWYPILNALQERIMQVALWKMANETAFGSPNYGIPLYHINDGRGYPNLGDAPVYPYVNTVYNSEPTVNNPANSRVLFALGTTDGIPKNALMIGDQILLSWDPPVFNGPNAEVTVHALVQRGPQALMVGNTSASGIRLLITHVNGQITASDVFTNASGEATIVVSQSRENPLPVTLTYCTHAVWPVIATPCDTMQPHQRMISGDVDPVCVTATIPPDDFLAAELNSFDAVATSEGIQLDWRTASESNLDRWEVQRSGAGLSFTTIASIAATNSMVGESYSYLDRSAQPGLTYRYRLVEVDVSGVRTVHDDFVRAASMPLIHTLPLTYYLGDNYPNPFNPQTTIRFGLPEDAHVTLKVYDVTGAEIATLVNGDLRADEHAVTFDARSFPSGVYFYRLNAGTFSETKKMILLK